MPSTSDRIALLTGWVRGALDPERVAWFEATLDVLRGGAGERELARALGLAPRKLGKADLAFTAEDLDRANKVRAGFDPAGLTVHQAARIAFLLAAARSSMVPLVRTRARSSSIGPSAKGPTQSHSSGLTGRPATQRS